MFSFAEVQAQSEELYASNCIEKFESISRVGIFSVAAGGAALLMGGSRCANMPETEGQQIHYRAAVISSMKKRSTESKPLREIKAKSLGQLGRTIAQSCFH
eukprot:scaffold164600_cov17-Prasinocladus_malaysianus.AAC.1